MGIVLFIVVTGICYMVFTRNSLVNQSKKLNQLLYIEKSPEKYIAEVDKLIKKFQSARERNINLIQKTTGLLYAGRFEESIKILFDDIDKIPPNWQHVYYHNLIASLFFNGETKRANEVLLEAKDVLDDYAKIDANKTAIEFLYAMSDFYKGNGMERKEFFENLSEMGRNDYRIALGYYFLGKINELENNIDESEENLEQSKIYGKGSFIEELS